MTESLATCNVLPATKLEVLDAIYAVENAMREMEQLPVQTEHTLHAGLYARTVRLEANALVVNVLIKCPTTIVVSGHARIFAGDRWYLIEGYNVIPASAGRKHLFVTLSPTNVTMLFATKAKTVEEAEAEFTDEVENLISRKSDNDLIVIGELWQE